jgi:VWFA-related protein
MRNRSRAYLSILLLAILVPAAPGNVLAQGNPARLGSIEVAVTEKGAAVTGLSKDDFQLLIDGKQQPIVNFEAVTAGSGQGKSVVILFDVHAMGASQTQVSQVAAEKYVQRQMRPGDLFAVAVYGRNLELAQAFTGDPAKVLEAIRRPMTSFGKSELEVGFKGAEGLQLAKNALRSLTALCQDLSQLGGRKSVLVFTQDFRAPSGEEFPRLIEAARRAKVVFYTLITTAASANLRSPDAVSDPLAQAALEEEPDEEQTTSTRVSARRLPRLLPGSSSSLPGLVTSFQQTSPGPPPHPTGPTGTMIQDSSDRDSVTLMDQLGSSDDVLQSLAKETAGDVVRESNDLNQALDAFDVSLSNYYILYFNLTGRSERHKVEVKMRRRGVKLQHARQYYPDGEQTAALPKAALKAFSEIEAPQLPAGQFPIRMQPVFFYRSSEVADVICYFGFDEQGLKAAEGGTSLVLPVSAVALREDGTLAARFDQAQEFTGTACDHSIHHALLTLPAGKYRVRIAVAAEGRLGVAEKEIEIPPLPTGQLAASSLVLNARLRALPDLIRSAPAALVGSRHPLVFKGYEVAASLDDRADLRKPLALFFTLYNVKDVSMVSELVSDTRFTDEKGETYLLAPVQHLSTAEPAGPGRVSLAFSIPIDSLRPGKYHVKIYTYQAGSDDTAVCEADVTLEL